MNEEVKVDYPVYKIKRTKTFGSMQYNPDVRPNPSVMLNPYAQYAEQNQRYKPVPYFGPNGYTVAKVQEIYCKPNYLLL